MADLSFVQVAADSTGKRLRTTTVADGGSTMHQEIMVVAGGTGDIWEPAVNAIPSSSGVAFPVFSVTSASSINGGTRMISTGLGTAAIDPRAITQSSTWDVRVIGAGSSASVGSVLVTTGLGGSAIDPRIIAPGSTLDVRIIGAASSGVLGTVLSATGLTGASIDVRQATIVAATSGAGLGTILSTGVGGAAIDPRAITQASTWDVRVIGAASSGILGTVLSATGLGAAAIDVRQVTVVAGTSGAYISVLNATAQGAAAIDPRQVTVVAGTSGAGIGTILSTAFGAAAIDPRIIAAQATSVVLGTVAVQQSTAYVSVTRDFADSTANYNQLYYWTTGIVAAAAATMQSLNLTKNLSSGSSGTSFNVAAGKFFRIDHVEGSIRVSSGTDLYADFAIRAVTSTGGATGTNFPVFYYRISANAESTNALSAGGGGASFDLSGLRIDLPSSASYGVSITSNSTASQECTFAFGGKEITL